MSAQQYNTTERPSQDKKSEWEQSLIVGQHAYFLHQNLQQAPQHVYKHHHHLAGASVEGTTFQPAGADQLAFGSLNPTTDMQSNANAGQGLMPLLRENSDAVSFSHAGSGIPPLHAASSNNNHKGSVNIAVSRLRHSRGAVEERMHQGKTGAALSMSTTSKSSTPRRMRNSSLSPLTVRPIGTKDRHSKVRTAKGLRDRRVRLSAPTAIQFFDVQDRLGYDQPSKAVDWLIKKARAAIDELAPVEGVIVGDEMVDTPVGDWKLSKDHNLHMHSSFVKVKNEEQSLATTAGGGARAESRAKARERARERAKEKTTLPVVPNSATSMETTSTSPGRTPAQPFTPPPNVHVLPEFFLLPSQLWQQFDELHRPSDLYSMITPSSAPPPAPNLIPFTSPFFPTQYSAASSFMYSGEGPSVQYSALPTTYNTITTNNHTTNSPRGTLQSIFSNPAVSSMQTPPLMMMGGPVQAHAYGATTLSSIVRDASVHDQDAAFRKSSAELGSQEAHHHSRIPTRIKGMELESHVEETRITPSSMQADYQ